MGNFGNAALDAIELIRNGTEPEKAWRIALSNYTNSEATLIKGCSKHAFLGLVHAGLIRGISEYCQDDDSRNASYAVEAVRILHENPELENNRNMLWDSIRENQNAPKTQNGQLDIVLALWDAGEII